MSPQRGGSGASALALVFLTAAVAGVAVAFGSIRRTPGLEGWLTGVFGGGFLALLIAAGGAWAVMLLVLRPARKQAEAAMVADDHELAPLLRELEAVRLDTVRRVNAAALWRVPLGVVGAAVLWTMSQFTDDPADTFDLLMFMGFGALAGYFWASYQLGADYGRLYKQRLLPRIAAGFGALSWRPAQPPLDDFRRHQLFADWDAVEAEDEIAGQYRGLDLSIVELKLTKGSGKHRRTIFQGLTAAVTLPRGLRGVTVVVPDRGLVGNLAKRLSGGELEVVRLEDPAFEKAYEVYGSDQVAARALLTPAFMERFLALGASGRFGAPVALVQDNRLLLAMSAPRASLFEPPSYRKPAAGREAVQRLHDDIEAVLRAADAVIDLDQAARRQPIQGD
ncbi:MAG: hypothetical protein DI570_09915 [Phenylobacterium zucineum]|nr:MAG: hypothetical protein DI570_09915 [Phenylobacterium zucineum]